MIMLNTLICLLIAARIMFYERSAARHRPVMNWLAYIMAAAAGIEGLSGLLGVATVPSISSVVLKGLLCLALFLAHGNVAELFKNSLSGQCRLSRLLHWPTSDNNSPTIR